MEDAKRILILTADAGFGHRSAANAIAEALREHYGEEGAFDVVNPLEDRRVPALLRNSQSDYDKIVRQMPELYRLGYRASDAAVPTALMESALAVVMFEVLRDLVNAYRPDAIVVTYPLYQVPLSAMFTLTGRRIPVITVVTDLVTVHRIWFHEGIDLCLVPTDQAYDLALGYGLASEQVRVTGIPVKLEFGREGRTPAEVRAELGWQPDLATFLVVGGKRVGRLREVVRALDHSRLPMQLALVAGGDDDLYAWMQENHWHGVVHVYNFVEQMPTFMHAADAIVCKAGGLIVTESLASGLPMLLINVLPGQEQGNADYVVDGGAGELVEEPLDALERAFHWLEDDAALLEERADNARRLGMPRAAYDVAALVWDEAHRTDIVKAGWGRTILPRLKEIFGLADERPEQA